MSNSVKKPVLLVVLDGWGIEQAHEHNGVHLARTPNFDRLIKEFPYTELHASGEHVGLPDGQMSNSEVGNTTISARTIIYQDLVRISKDVKNGDFANNPALKQAFTHTHDHTSQLHLIGLVSTGGVHAHEDHFFELISAAKKAGVQRIILHPILDGRDSPRTEGAEALARLEKHIEPLDGVFIATVSGRYYPMDRDKNWDRTMKGFDAMWYGKGVHVYAADKKPSEVVREFYARDEYDEAIEPIAFQQSDGTHYTVNKNDSIMYTNFRTDRTRQLSQKICEIMDEWNLCFVTMTDYGQEISSVVAYEPIEIKATLASVIADAGLKQAHLAETDKYAHATYFLNGGRQDPHDNEEHVLVQSRKDVKTHDQAPEMKAKELCNETIARLGTQDFIFLNWANPDMVGHTAVREAIITAVETVDHELGRLSDAVLKADGTMLVIADHGNAERMIHPETGEAHTSHTTNLVPCILISNHLKEVKLKEHRGLQDIAPTILNLLGLPKADSMTGESIIS